MSSLVSIGIPTYNRPDGLLNTLKKITSQTYTNIEIIVSNNFSDNPLVAAIIDRCAELDPRIKKFHQNENIGIAENFKFVLKNATGEFFMWAADDDEWELDFIECCLGLHAQSQVGLVMPGFYRFNRELNIANKADLRRLTGDNKFLDAMSFLEIMQHSIFYGLHRRNSISWILSDINSYYADDEYLLIHQILKYGVRTEPDIVKFGAGMAPGPYKIKFPQIAPDRYFNQIDKLIPFIRLIADVDFLSNKEKIELFKRILITKLNFILYFEKDLRAINDYNDTFFLKNFLEKIDVNSIFD